MPTPTHSTLIDRWPIILALATVAAVCCRTVSQSTIWMHLSVGRWIREHGIPKTDPFSLMRSGEPWMDTTWLCDLLFYVVHSLGDMPAVISLHVISIVVAFWMLAAVAARNHASPTRHSSLHSAIHMDLTSNVASRSQELRPFFPRCFLTYSQQIHMFMAFIVLLTVLQTLWTNLSPTGVLGPILCLVFAVGAAYQRGQDKPNRPYMVVAATLLTALACILNPYGLAAAQSGILDLFGIRPQLSIEWISNYATLIQQSLPKHLITLALIIGIGGLLTFRQELPLGLTLVAVIGLLCSFSIRTLGQCSILIFPFVALSLSALMQTLLNTRRISQNYVRIIGPAAVIILAAFTLFAIVSNRYSTWVGSASRFGLGSDLVLVPTNAVNILSNFDDDTKILHHPQDAGYILWKQPQKRLAIDIRRDFHGLEAMKQYYNAFVGQTEAVDACIEQVEPDVVLVNLTRPNSGRLLRGLLASGSWEQIFVDGTASLLLPKNASRTRLELPPLNDGLQQLEAHHLAVKQAVESGHFSPRVAAMVGAGELFFSLRRWKETAAAYELVCHTYPNMSEAWFRLGYAQLQLKKPQDAAHSLGRALEMLPKEKRIVNATAEAFDQLGKPEEAQRLRNTASDT